MSSSLSSSVWSREEERAFENAIALHWTGESEEQWNKITSMIPTKSIDELKHHYQILVEDVHAIEAGLVPLPNYIGEETSSLIENHQAFSSGCGYGNAFAGLSPDATGQGGGKGQSRSDQERRKGIPWTEEEHRYLHFSYTNLVTFPYSWVL